MNGLLKVRGAVPIDRREPPIRAGTAPSAPKVVGHRGEPRRRRFGGCPRRVSLAGL